MSRIMNIVLLREIADKAITISTMGLAGARRPKHANMTISQNTSILRKGLAIERFFDDRPSRPDNVFELVEAACC